MRMMLGCTCMKGTVQANWRRRRLSCHSAQSRECEAAKTQILKEEKNKIQDFVIRQIAKYLRPKHFISFEKRRRVMALPGGGYSQKSNKIIILNGITDPTAVRITYPCHMSHYNQWVVLS